MFHREHKEQPKQGRDKMTEKDKALFDEWKKLKIENCKLKLSIEKAVKILKKANLYRQESTLFKLKRGKYCSPTKGSVIDTFWTMSITDIEEALQKLGDTLEFSNDEIVEVK